MTLIYVFIGMRDGNLQDPFVEGLRRRSRSSRLPC
jgi:hypothetical protein